MTESELVARAKAGDQDAFRQLIEDNEKRVYTLCLRMCGDGEDARDLAQEAFLSAWRGLPSFKGDSSFSTWVYRLASNSCIDFLRKRKRRQTAAPTASLDDPDTPWMEPSDPQQDPQRQLERQELRYAVRQGLSQLPEQHRQILVMREISGLSYQEIGQVLDLPPGTVKSRIARARLALKDFLQKNGTFPPQ
ncbi:MAG: sigma-70 family RNA polymerase sigma factor [Clostridium sp.]|nr:sigma-70 family RNA polymerase sigma factor [Clostridium sp.]